MAQESAASYVARTFVEELDDHLATLEDLDQETVLDSIEAEALQRLNALRDRR